MINRMTSDRVSIEFMCLMYDLVTKPFKFHVLLEINSHDSVSPT
jgi:hypothetical protein